MATYSKNVFLYLKVTQDKDSSSNSNIVKCKLGHLSLNIHTAKREHLQYTVLLCNAMMYNVSFDYVLHLCIQQMQLQNDTFYNVCTILYVYTVYTVNSLSKN